MSNYQELGYDLSNLTSYNIKKLEDNFQRINVSLSEMELEIKKFNRNKEFFFFEISNKFNYTSLLPDNTIESNKFYLSLFETYMRSSELVNLAPYSLNSQQSSPGTLYYSSNMLNSILSGYTEFNEKMENEILEQPNSFYYQMATFFVISCVTIIISLIISILAVYSIFKSFKEVYRSFNSLGDTDISIRSRQLRKMISLIDFFNMNQSSINILEIEKMLSKKGGKNYDEFDNLNDSRSRLFRQMSRTNIALESNKKQLNQKSSKKGILGKKTKNKDGTDKIRNKKKKVMISDQFYYFNLSFGTIMIISFYSTIIIFFLLLSFFIYNSITTASWIFERQSATNQISIDQVSNLLMIKQLALYGTQLEAFGSSIEQQLEVRYLLLQNQTDKILTAFKGFGNDNSYEYLLTKLDKIRSQNLCSEVGTLEERKELCELLEDGIAKKGIVQLYFRIRDYLNEIISEIQQNKGAINKLAKTSQFIEFNYSFDNIIFDSIEQVSKLILDSANHFLKQNIEQILLRLIQAYSFYILTTFILIYLALKNIQLQGKRVYFSFQMINIDSILNNSQIKYKFKKIMGLKNDIK